MGSTLAEDYVAAINRLDLDTRLAIVSGISEGIRRSIDDGGGKDKSALVHELFGAWHDVDAEELIENIYAHRSLPDRDVSFDE